MIRLADDQKFLILMFSLIESVELKVFTDEDFHILNEMGRRLARRLVASEPLRELERM